VILVLSISTSGYAIGISGLVPYNISDAEWEQLELIEEKINIQIVPGRDTRSCYKMTQDYFIRNKGSISCNIQIGIFVTDEYDPSPVPEGLRFFVNGIEYKYTIIPHEVIYLESVVSEEKIRNRTVNRIIIDVNHPPETDMVVRIQYTNTWDNLYGNATIMCKKNPYYDLSKYYTDWSGMPIFAVTIGNYVYGDYNFEHQWIDGIRFFPKTGDGTIKEDYLWNMLINMEIPENELFKIKKTSENAWEVQFTEQFVKQYELAFYFYIAWWGGELGGYCILRGNELELQSAISSMSKISERKLAPYELILLTNKQLRIMRNAFYARHGYIFKDEELRKLFLKYVDYGFNYHENPNFSESMLTEIDRANIATIQRLEAMEFEQ
jgi:hypothetical protein